MPAYRAHRKSPTNLLAFLRGSPKHSELESSAQFLPSEGPDDRAGSPDRRGRCWVVFGRFFLTALRHNNGLTRHPAQFYPAVILCLRLAQAGRVVLCFTHGLGADSAQQQHTGRRKIDALERPKNNHCLHLAPRHHQHFHTWHPVHAVVTLPTLSLQRSFWPSSKTRLLATSRIWMHEKFVVFVVRAWVGLHRLLLPWALGHARLDVLGMQVHYSHFPCALIFSYPVPWKI